MLKSFITGIMLLSCIPITNVGATEPKDNQQLIARIKPASQTHDWLPQTSAKREANQRIFSVKTGDIFRGIVSLAEPHHNPAELTLLIRNTTSKGAPENEFEIEVTAVMKIGTTQTVYGLHGVYAPKCQQMNLYEVQDLPAASVPISAGTIINNVIFEPVGLAGKFTDDGNTIQCAIAYNGNASLERLANKKPHQVSEIIQLEN